MLLSRFKHHRPTRLDAVHDILARHGDDATVYAGGTELLLALKARVLRYEHLVDLKRVSELNVLKVEGDQLVVGSLVTHHRLATDALVRRTVPSYAALSNNIANIRVRVAGTLGGNLCFAEPHADPPALLSAVGATVTLRSADGLRSVPVSEFIEGEFSTARRDDELLTEIRIPVTGADETYCYKSFGHLERPAVGVAAGCIRRAGGIAYRIWIGAIGDHPLHAESVEAALAGVRAEALMDVLPQATETAAADLPAHDDLHGSADYKRHLAAVLMRRAVLEAAGQPREARHG